MIENNNTETEQNNESAPVKSYTQSEVANLLNISKSTVYHYSKQKKIHKIEDPFQLQRGVRYRAEEVDAMLSKVKIQPTGYKPSVVAKKLGISTQTIYKYIRDGIISADEIPFGDERSSFVISEESIEAAKIQIREMEPERARKAEYYDSQNDIALFQCFHSFKIAEARAMKNKENEWVFYLPLSQSFITYKEGIKDFDLVPVYSIHKDSLDYKGYSHLMIKKTEDIFYPLIDFLYTQLGVENVRIRDRKNIVQLSVKAGTIPFNREYFSFEDVLPFVKEGTWELSGTSLIIKSAYTRTTVELPIEMHKAIKKIISKENITISQYIERILEDVLEE